MRLYTLLFCLTVGVIYPLFSRAENQTVVINELMWMGSSASSADEWIELRNLTDAVVDISGWQLTKRSSGQEVAMLTIPAGKTIPAQGFFLISNYAATSTSSALAVVSDVVMTDVALGNSAAQIKLYDAAHLLIDTADDGAGNPLAGEYVGAEKVYASMERNPVPGDGTEAQNWHSASRGVGFKTDSLERGTPGTVNSNGRPMAVAGPDVTGTAGETINFDGSESSDPEGQVLTYRWDFGDGQSAEGATPAHVFSAAGTYKTVLTVSDGVDEVKDELTAVIEAAPVGIDTAAGAPPSGAPAATVSAVPETPAAIAVVISCRGLILDSIWPNPVGSDDNEDVVIKNPTSTAIDPNGCGLMAGAKKWVIKGLAAVTTAGKVNVGYAVSKLRLSNAGAIVKLLDVDGAVLDQATYLTALEGRRWMNDNGTWRWDSTAAVAKKSKTTTSSKKTKTDEPVVELKSLGDLQAMESGDVVIVTGVVTAPVGALGERLTYIEANEAAAAVVLAEGAKKIAVGDKITVKGKVRTSNGRRRVAANKDGIKIISHQEPVAKKIILDETGPEQSDRLMEVSGVIASIVGGRFTLDDGTGEISVTLKSTSGIVRPAMAAGDKATVVGIVSAGTTGLKIMPRVRDDIKVERVLGAATTSTNPTNAPVSQNNQTMWYWLAAGVGVVAGNGKRIWMLIRRP